MANDEQTKVAKKKATKKTASKKTVAKKAAVKKEAAGSSANGRMRVTLVKSLIGTIGHHRDTVRGLGLRKLNHTVDVEDTPATRGMVNKVRYLVRVEKD